MTLFGPVFAAGVMLGCKALDSGEELELSHLFGGFRSRTGTLIGVGALYLAATIAVALVVSLVMGVGMMTMMGGGDQQAVAAMGMTFVLAVLIAAGIAASRDDGCLACRAARRIPRPRRNRRQEGQLHGLPEERHAFPALHGVVLAVL
jgi:hypothetical protein